MQKKNKEYKLIPKIQLKQAIIKSTVILLIPDIVFKRLNSLSLNY